MTTGRPITRELIETIVIAVIVGLFVRTFLFQAFKIPSGSMEQNLLVGDHLLVNRFVFAPARSRLERLCLPMRPFRRFDVVVFKFPTEPARDFVKRVIGLPGETVELRARRVYVDGHPIDEPFVRLVAQPAPPVATDERTVADVREQYGPVKVPAGHLFVMGDNRDNSEDSRYWGFLPERYVKGRAMFVYWSFDPEPVHSGGVGGWLARLSGHTRWSRVGIGVR